MRIEKQVTELEIQCDQCSKSATVITDEDLRVWISLSIIEDMGLRLMEKKVDKKRFETFNLNHKKKELDFCSVQCANKFLLASVQVFISEVLPITPR